MDDDGAGVQAGFEQAPLQDVEPPGGVARRVIVRAFAKMAALRAQEGGGDLLDCRV
jgi:hypothetical protein